MPATSRCVPRAGAVLRRAPDTQSPGHTTAWLRGDAFDGGLRRLAARLPIVSYGTVLDSELTSGRLHTTIAAQYWYSSTGQLRELMRGHRLAEIVALRLLTFESPKKCLLSTAVTMLVSSPGVVI